MKISTAPFESKKLLAVTFFTLAEYTSKLASLYWFFQVLTQDVNVIDSVFFIVLFSFLFKLLFSYNFLAAVFTLFFGA